MHVKAMQLLLQVAKDNREKTERVCPDRADVIHRQPKKTENGACMFR